MSQQDFLTDFSNSIITDVDYLVITTNYKQPIGSTQISDSDQNELYRITPSFNLVNNEIKANISIGDITIPEDAISSVTNQKVFNLSSVLGFKEGDAIILNYNNPIFEKREIIDITGNQITLDKEASLALAVNMRVTVGLEWIHFITGGSSSANTGFTMLTRNLSIVKFPSSEQNFDLIFGGKIK